MEVCVACKTKTLPPELGAVWLDVVRDVVRGRMPPSEIEIDGVAGVSDTEVVNREVVVSSPLAGQFEMPGAQLITVVTLVTKAVDIGIGTEE